MFHILLIRYAILIMTKICSEIEIILMKKKQQTIGLKKEAG